MSDQRLIGAIPVKTAHEIYSDVSAAFTRFYQPPDPEALPDAASFVELYDDLASLLADLKKYRDPMSRWPKPPLTLEVPPEDK